MTDDQKTLGSVAHQAAGLSAVADSLRIQVERDAIRGGASIDAEALAQNLEKLAWSLRQLHFRARGSEGPEEQAWEENRKLGPYRPLTKKKRRRT